MATKKPSKPQDEKSEPSTEPKQDTTWSDKRWACIASYNILESNDLLDQFEAFLLPFKDAGAHKLQALPYAQANLSAGDLQGRADQMARKFFYYIVQLYTGRKEDPQSTVMDVHEALRSQFASPGSTFLSLADTIDSFIRGVDE